MASVIYLCRMDRIFILLVALATIAQSVWGQDRLWGHPTPCRYGSVGVCRWNGLCPTGSTCQLGWYGTRGRCCRDKPVVIEECRFGQRGICGGIAGLQCPAGTRCQGMQSFPDAAGKCCITRPPTEKCKYGQRGVCGGFAGFTCDDGYTCRFLPTDIADGMGKCCKNPSKGKCPPPSGLAGICVFDPEVNCLGDDFCPSGSLCCSEGCGRVCKPAVTPGLEPPTKPPIGPPIGPVAY